MDEVVDVVLPYEKRTTKERVEGITRSDLNCILNNYGHLDVKTHLIVWDDDTYDGGLNKYKKMCELGCLALYGTNQTPLWLFPVDVFTAFKEVYVMTYMFDAQIQKYYYDLKGIEYEYLYVECEGADTFPRMIKYMEENEIPLVGAVHDFTCPETGKNYMFFPIGRL